MSYIGNPIVSTDFPVDYFSGNGSTTAFTLSVAPASVNSISVQVSGVVQSPQTYSVSGTTLTFTAAPPTGSSNIVVRHLGIGGIPNTPSAASVVTSSIAANAVTPSKMANGGAEFGMRNRIINGDMRIDQRNAGASVTSTGANYSVDRWIVYASVTSKFTVQQNAGSVTPPAGFTNYLGATSSSAYTVGASEYYSINQPIEGFNTADLNWGTANAKTVTLSAWVYSSLTGTFGGAIQNYARTRSYPFSYSIPVANTWTQISITITGDTSGTWVGASNAGSMFVIFSLGTGSTISGTAGSWSGNNYQSATGATSVVGTNGATFYITGVQLEVGSSATGFEYRQYGQELVLCQRYTQVFGGDSNYNSVGSNGIASTSTLVDYYSFPLPVKLRTNPSLSWSGNWRIDDAFTASYAVTAIAINGIALNQTAGVISIGVASGLTAGRAYQLQSNNNTTARIILSAEL